MTRERLVWRNVAAPDFMSASNMMARASEHLNQAFGGLSDVGHGIHGARVERGSTDAMLGALRYTDSADWTQALQAGQATSGVNPMYVDRQAVSHLGQHRTGLLGNEQTMQNMEIQREQAARAAEAHDQRMSGGGAGAGRSGGGGRRSGGGGRRSSSSSDERVSSADRTTFNDMMGQSAQARANGDYELAYTIANEGLNFARDRDIYAAVTQAHGAISEILEQQTTEFNEENEAIGDLSLPEILERQRTREQRQGNGESSTTASDTASVERTEDPETEVVAADVAADVDPVETADPDVAARSDTEAPGIARLGESIRGSAGQGRAFAPPARPDRSSSTAPTNIATEAPSVDVPAEAPQQAPVAPLGVSIAAAAGAGDPMQGGMTGTEGSLPSPSSASQAAPVQPSQASQASEPSQPTYQDWRGMTRSERRRAGLPVSEIGGQLHFSRFNAGIGERGEFGENEPDATPGSVIRNAQEAAGQVTTQAEGNAVEEDVNNALADRFARNLEPAIASALGLPEGLDLDTIPEITPAIAGEMIQYAERVNEHRQEQASLDEQFERDRAAAERGDDLPEGYDEQSVSLRLSTNASLLSRGRVGDNFVRVNNVMSELPDTQDVIALTESVARRLRVDPEGSHGRQLDREITELASENNVSNREAAAAIITAANNRNRRIGYFDWTSQYGYNTDLATNFARSMSSDPVGGSELDAAQRNGLRRVSREYNRIVSDLETTGRQIESEMLRIRRNRPDADPERLRNLQTRLVTQQNQFLEYNLRERMSPYLPADHQENPRGRVELPQPSVSGRVRRGIEAARRGPDRPQPEQDIRQFRSSLLQSRTPDNSTPGQRIAVLGMTRDDVRDTLVSGSDTAVQRMFRLAQTNSERASNNTYNVNNPDHPLNILFENIPENRVNRIPRGLRQAYREWLSQAEP